MELKNKIIKIKPREKSGPITGNRIDYQQDWALCKILELYASDQDFVVVFDYHDDVLIFDSEIDLDNASFYQVKTQHSGAWTLRDLIAHSKGEKGILHSKIGKLYDHKIKFDRSVKSLNFVSNQCYNIKLSDADEKSLNKNNICFIELDEKELSKIREALKKEHALTSEPEFEKISFLSVTDLSLHDHSIHTRGKLNYYIKEKNPYLKLNIETIYLTLHDEIKRRNNYEWDIGQSEELLRNKAMSKSQFVSILEGICRSADVSGNWELIRPQLRSEGEPIPCISRIKEAWNIYEVQRMDKTNTLIQKMRDAVVEIMDRVDACDYDKNLRELIKIVSEEYNALRPVREPFINDDYIKAIVLMEYCEICE